MSGSRSKRGLADFLSQELKSPPPAIAETEVRHSATSEVREKNVHASSAERPPIASPAELPESHTAEVAKSRTTVVSDAAGDKSEPLYLRLTRKDVRFRDEQLGALHALARRLSKARRGAKGERITDNTLVRVAVDLLLLHGDELAGANEPALLESLRKLSRKRG